MRWWGVDDYWGQSHLEWCALGDGQRNSGQGNGTCD